MSCVPLLSLFGGSVVHLQTLQAFLVVFRNQYDNLLKIKEKHRFRPSKNRKSRIWRFLSSLQREFINGIWVFWRPIFFGKLEISGRPRELIEFLTKTFVFLRKWPSTLGMIRKNYQKVPETAGGLLKSISSTFMVILEVAKRTIVLFKNNFGNFLKTFQEWKKTESIGRNGIPK